MGFIFQYETCINIKYLIILKNYYLQGSSICRTNTVCRTASQSYTLCKFLFKKKADTLSLCVIAFLRYHQIYVNKMN
jgi:hypothetical protein